MEIVDYKKLKDVQEALKNDGFEEFKSVIFRGNIT